MQSVEKAWRIARSSLLAILLSLGGHLCALAPSDATSEYARRLSQPQTGYLDALEYCLGLSEAELLSMGEALARRQMPAQLAADDQATTHVAAAEGPIVTGFIPIFRSWTEVAEPTPDDVLRAVKEAEDNFVWRDVLLSYFTSKLSPFSPRERADLAEEADACLQPLLSAPKREDIRRRYDSLATIWREGRMREGGLSSGDREDLGKRVARLVRDIDTWLASSAMLDAGDAVTYAWTLWGLTEMGLASRSWAASRLHALFLRSDRVGMEGRILLATYLIRQYGQKSVRAELEKIKLAPENRSSLHQVSPTRHEPVLAALERAIAPTPEEIGNPMQVLQVLRDHSVDVYLWNACKSVIRESCKRLRFQSISAWTKENHLGLLSQIEEIAQNHKNITPEAKDSMLKWCDQSRRSADKGGGIFTPGWADALRARGVVEYDY